MELLVKYKSGEFRRVNLTQDFFTYAGESTAKRSLDFAYMHGADPLYILLYRNGGLMYEKRFKQEEVPYGAKKETKADEKDIKKQLRKEFKNVKFTTKYRLF